MARADMGGEAWPRSSAHGRAAPAAPEGSVVTHETQSFRVGFVGAGAIAGVTSTRVTRRARRAFRSASPTGTRRARAALASRVRGLRVFPDLAAMIAAGVDVVHVLTPPHAHAAVALEADRARLSTCWSRSRSRPAQADCARLAEAARAARPPRRREPLAARPTRTCAACSTPSPRAASASALSAEYFCSCGLLRPGATARCRRTTARAATRSATSACTGSICCARCSARSKPSSPPSRRAAATRTCASTSGTRSCAARAARAHPTCRGPRDRCRPCFTVQATGGTLRADVGSMFVSARRAEPLPQALDRTAGALQDGWPACGRCRANGARG